MMSFLEKSLMDWKSEIQCYLRGGITDLCAIHDKLKKVDY